MSVKQNVRIHSNCSFITSILYCTRLTYSGIWDNIWKSQSQNCANLMLCVSAMVQMHRCSPRQNTKCGTPILEDSYPEYVWTQLINSMAHGELVMLGIKGLIYYLWSITWLIRPVLPVHFINYPSCARPMDGRTGGWLKPWLACQLTECWNIWWNVHMMFQQVHASVDISATSDDWTML